MALKKGQLEKKVVLQIPTIPYSNRLAVASPSKAVDNEIPARCASVGGGNGLELELRKGRQKKQLGAGGFI